MSLTSLVSLLQGILMLLTFVNANPNVSPQDRTEAIQLAQTVLSQVTAEYSTLESSQTSLTQQSVTTQTVTTNVTTQNNVLGSPTCTESLSPSTVSPGQTLTETWSSSNATSMSETMTLGGTVVFGPGPTGLQGTLQLNSDNPGGFYYFMWQTPGTYTITRTVSGSGQSSSCSASVTVLSAPIVAIFTGDSRTDPKGDGGGEGPTGTWPYLFLHEDSAFANASSSDIAVDGNTTSDILAQFSNNLVPPAPVGSRAYYFVWVGINDLGGNHGNPPLSPNAVYQNLLTIWSDARKLGYKVVAFTSGPGCEISNVYALNQLITSDPAAYDYLAYPDYVLSSCAANASNYFADSVHPNEAGNAVIAQTVENTLADNPPKQPPISCTESISPAVVTVGQQFTESWGSWFADSMTETATMNGQAVIGPGPTGLGGTLTSSWQNPGAYVYTRTVTGPSGTASCSATLTVQSNMPTCTESLSPSTVSPGQTLTETWSSSNATSMSETMTLGGTVVFGPGPTGLQGTLQLNSDNPGGFYYFMWQTPGTYTITRTVSGSGQSSSCSASVTVSQ